jgi:diaminohydroxyphosphoribosylaminopyrimidine deaminase/5-amino-6-(5-phosphoribosylamino)uracil reductase
VQTFDELEDSGDAGCMAQAIALAMGGRGAVEPNPMVGCVIVRDGRVNGSGFHERCGGPHAEPNALANCNEPTHGATVYVNLEPCCHTGKKTPPCVPRLIEAKVGRVVVGCEDPNPAVAGMGIAQLRAAGIEVVVGICEAECKQLNAPFFALHREHRPYVTLKWAESADGKVAAAAGRRMQISGPEASRATHRLRAGFDAILIGIETALADDPLLTTRGIEAPRPLARIVLDSSLRLPPASKLVATAREQATHVFGVEPKSDPEWTARATVLIAAGVHVHTTPPDANGKVDLAVVLQKLAEEFHATHLLVEGGPKVHQEFIRRGFADRAWVVRSPITIGAPDAPSAMSLPDSFERGMEIAVATDTFTEYFNRLSPVCFEIWPSVDALAILGYSRTLNY